MSDTKPRAPWRDDHFTLLMGFANLVLALNLIFLYLDAHGVLSFNSTTRYTLYGGIGISLILLGTGALTYWTRRKS